MGFLRYCISLLLGCIAGFQIEVVQVVEAYDVDTSKLVGSSC